MAKADRILLRLLTGECVVTCIIAVVLDLCGLTDWAMLLASASVLPLLMLWLARRAIGGHRADG